MSVQDEKPAVTIDSFDLGELTGPPVPVPVRVARTAARRPDRPALRCGDRVLTYGGLAERVAEVAARLASAGAVPGDVVAVRGEDRFEQVTGLLAVWRAGGVHLALDPAAPAGRNERLIERAGVKLLLANGEVKVPPPDSSERRPPRVAPGGGAGPAAVPGGGDPRSAGVRWSAAGGGVGPVAAGPAAVPGGGNLRSAGVRWSAAGGGVGPEAAVPDGGELRQSGVRWNAAGDGVEPEAATAAGPAAVPGGRDLPIADEQLAYLVHTSGTTGEPKAVAVAHGPLAAHVEAISARFGLRADDVVLHFARSTVDVAVEQITTALTAGACLVVPEAKLLSAEEFWQLLETERVTVANVAAGYFHDLVASISAGRVVPPSLRTMISGSDRLSPAAAATWLEKTGVRLLNAYGPTETVITSTVHEVRPGRGVTVGTPVGDRVAHLLDDHLRPVAEGELYLGGSALAAGYLGDGGRTAERFVPDPFTGGRMYRTGDRARRTADGELEFLGRADDQVKIRGFRVEPGEVENALSAHPAVAACAVVPHEAANGTQLAAYVVAKAEAPGYPEIRDFLAKSLPEHLIPASVTPLEQLPLTAAGKVDRAALPEPARADTGYRAPRTPAEQLLAAIWADVLGVPRVGLDDNFFHLGGDSLTAVRVAGRVLEVFGPVSPYRIFDAPTLESFAAAMNDDAGDARPGPVRTPATEAPLSRFQRGLWLLDAWQPGTSTYNVPWVFDFTGPLDDELLRTALQQIADRHEALRTTFEVTGTLPRQVIHPRLEVPFRITEAADPAGLIAADARTPFDLETGPLLRARLIRTSATTASLVLVFHHIVWDEGSLAVLDRELRECYTALLEGREPRLPDLAVQYADYAKWLQDNGIAETQLAYWAEHLRGLPDRPALAPDHPRPAEPAQICGYHRFAFDAELAAAVREFARDADATPFMVLLAGLVLAVHRTGGADDLVFGTPVSVRERPELDALIGYFITLVPLRFRIEPGATLRDVLEHVRGVALDGYRHQDVPLEEITSRVLGERSGERNPLFQLVFEMHTADPSPLPFGEARLSRRLHVNELSRFDLSWSVEDDGTGFTGRIEYDTDLFDAATLTALGEAWRTAVTDLVTDPDVVLAEPVPAGPDLPVHELFEQQVRRGPDAVALVSGDDELSYAELNARANRVARRLRAHGVTPGAVVAVAIERDTDLVVALLAALKAGAGYTLLDPELPEARRADAIAAVQARLVVDREFVAAADGPDDDLGIPVSADAVACVMFTSGSTGRPKGVAASHRALAATYLGQDYALFAPGEVWLQCSPVSWDAFGLEVYGPLLFGGTCVLHPGQRPDPETMTGLVARHGVTQLQLSATLFNFLVDEFPAIFAGLRVVFTGGERASVPHVARLRERYPHVRIVNGYGPVESMGFTTCHVVGDADVTADAIPIGVPVAHKDVRVLDDGFRPSAEGELYATGDGLAIGYVGQPGLTADRFLPDPLGPPGSRMYRTGDVGGRTPGGTLTITGRADDQVKIRGFRVEPGEVAAALARHPGVKDCAVVAHAGGLAAYLVARDTPPGYQDACDHLATLLPDYMIPASVTVLAALPLTHNGKLDRAALPSPESAVAAVPAEPAVTEAERLVAAVWAEVLGVDAVGMDDSFFRLGGNSLAAVRVALRLSTETGTRVAPRLVFAARTVRALARRLEVRA